MKADSMLASLGLMLFAPMVAIAAPANTTLSQSGSSSLQFTQDHIGTTEQMVTFMEPFGGIPSVSVVPQPGQIYLTCPHAIPHGHWAVKNITRQSFTAYLTGGCVSSGLKFNWTAAGPKLFNGYVIPSYLIIAIVYAPPGTKGGHSTNSVNYQNGSTLGVSTSASQSFTQGTAISVEASGGVLAKGDAGVSFEISNSVTDTDTLDIKKTVNSSIISSGPASDGIDHDEDQIWLLLTPKVSVSVSTDMALWDVSPDSGTMQYVHVGWLNGHQPMPPGLKRALDSAGITQDIYPDILSHDPAVTSPPSRLPDRYTFITKLPYEPPYGQADTAPTYTYTLSNAETSGHTHEMDDSIKVTASFGGGADFAGMANLKFKATSSWQWTNKDSLTRSTGTTQSAQLTLGGPAFGYPGPTATAVYIDNVYHTFAFELVNSDTQPARFYARPSENVIRP